MINKVIILGRLGKDPEMRATPNGTSIAKFTVATDEKYTDRSGQKQERTEWHDVEAWDRLGEICGQYLRKGSLVYIEGSIRTDSWDDKETGQKRSRKKIVAREMKMLDRRNSDEGGGSSGGYSNSYGQSRGGSSKPASDMIEDDEEVPF